MPGSSNLHHLPYPLARLRQEFESFLAAHFTDIEVKVREEHADQVADLIIISAEFSAFSDVFSRSQMLSRLYAKFWNKAAHGGERPPVSMVGLTPEEARRLGHL